MLGSPPAPDRSLFTTRMADLPTGVRLAYVRSGEGGYPLLLLHGYPETKRIWWRNIRPLAEVGFDVLAPDLRGYGESGFAPDGHYDPAAYSIDLHALLSSELGIERCVAVGGDIVRAGPGAVEGDGEDCPVVEGLPTVAVCVGLTST